MSTGQPLLGIQATSCLGEAAPRNQVRLRSQPPDFTVSSRQSQTAPPDLAKLMPSSYLVADEVPLLLAVILSQQPGLVRRQVHGALRREAELTPGRQGSSRAPSDPWIGKQRHPGGRDFSCLPTVTVKLGYTIFSKLKDMESI